MSSKDRYVLESLWSRHVARGDAATRSTWSPSIDGMEVGYPTLEDSKTKRRLTALAATLTAAPTSISARMVAADAGSVTGNR